MTTTQIDEMQPPLLRKDLNDDPFVQFENWFEAAGKANVPDREAMALSTVDAHGRVSSRMVLLRGHGNGLYTFFTNYTSDKSADIADNPSVSLLFFWPSVYQQIRIAGRAKRSDTEVSSTYFRQRPRASQIGAWASRQGSVVADRQELDDRYTKLKAKFEGQDVPDPDFWGGFDVVPEQFEFWQGQPSRMHDRFRYRLTAGAWTIERLAP